MFFFRKIKYLLISIFFLIFITVTFIAIDDNKRRSIISKVLVLHDIYRVRSLTYGLQVRDFALLSDRLNDYIDASKYFSDGRTYMFPGIYEATELVVSRALTQDDYNKLESIFEKLLELDNRIYKLHVWYARALKDNDIEKSLKHIDIAIKISPSQEEAYREALSIAQIIKDSDLSNKYCNKYQREFLGGHKPLHFPTMFDSFNNQKFAISLNNLNDPSLRLISSNFVLNKDKTYEFVFERKTDLDGFDIYIAPLNNLKLKLEEIKYFIKGQEYLIKINDLSVTSNQSLIIEEKGEIFEIISTKLNEEILKFRHKEIYNAEKLTLSINIKKMKLTSGKLCKSNL